MCVLRYCIDTDAFHSLCVCVYVCVCVSRCCSVHSALCVLTGTALTLKAFMTFVCTHVMHSHLILLTLACAHAHTCDALTLKAVITVVCA